jgi:hypothetical protein
MFGHRDHVAAHQAACGFLREGERFLDRGAVVRIERAEDGALIVLLHILDDRDGVVGIQLSGDMGDFVRLELVDQPFAHPVIHLGENFAVEQIGKRRRQHPPVVRIHQLEQIGDVGRVKRLHQLVRTLDVAGFDPRHHLADESGFQPVILVQPVLGRFGQGAAGRFEFAVAHRPLQLKSAASRFLGREARPVDICRAPLAARRSGD